MFWQGYLSINQFSSMSDEAWVLFVTRVREIVVRGRDSHQKLSYKASLDKFNAGTEENPAWYSREYIVLGNFKSRVIDADVIKAWLVTIFDENPDLVTYTIGHITIRNRPTAYAIYAYGGNDMLRIAFFGCNSSAELCTEEESGIEANGWKDDHIAEWEEHI